MDIKVNNESNLSCCFIDKIDILNEEERFYVEMLIKENQIHIFKDWKSGILLCINLLYKC
jgi:hypothetical protein